MEDLVGGLMSIAVACAIVYSAFYALGRIILAPIHAKLDRLLALQEQALQSELAGRSPVGAERVQPDR
jgi:hypothetical protein